MFNKKNYKKVIITVLALTMILGTVALAAEGIYTKKLTATYGRVKFNYEGSDVTSQIEDKYGIQGFLAGGSAYAPVRAIADLVGVDVDYDNNTNTVKITDRKIQEHKDQLADKDTEIAKLKAEIEKLEKKAKEEEKKEEVSKTDLKTLETSLNKKYSEYEKVDFDIVLKEEKNNKITIDITTNLSNARDEQNWIRMRYTDKKYLIEDAVDQVEKEFKNADITGIIYDSFSRRNLYTFKLNTNGTVSITNNDYTGGYDDRDYGYGSLDSYVWDEFDGYGIRGAKLSGRNGYFEIEFSDTLANEEIWYKLGESKIRSMLDRIAWEIEREYDYEYGYYDDIRIDIKMGASNEGRYTKYYRENSGTFKY